MRGLDSAAIAYARLLKDPCNAPLVPPVYQGSGSGNYVRVRKFVAPLVDTNTSLQYCFDPQTNFRWFGQAVADATGNVGQPDQVFSQTNWKQFRCLAACMKVRYIASEMERGGVVGLICSPPIFTPLQTGVGSGNTLGSCAVIHRFGDVLHEVKWIPDNDVSWVKATSTGDPTSYGTENVLTAILSNVPAQSVMIELTAVYEVAYQFTAGMVSTSQVSKSVNTFNQVVHALGEPVNWLYGNVIAPTVKSLATAAVNTTMSGMSATAARGALLLTL